VAACHPRRREAAAAPILDRTFRPRIGGGVVVAAAAAWRRHRGGE